MINLLPPFYRERLKQEERFRLLTILGISLATFLLVLALLLLLVRVILVQELSFQSLQLASLEEQFSKEDSVLQEVKSTNLTVERIKEFRGEKQSLNLVLQELASSLPENLFLQTFSYTPPLEKRKKDEVTKIPAKIAVTGEASTRKLLLQFKETLQKSSAFSQVTFPPSNWVSPTDISFSFQATLEQ
tara:strand:+ start:1920 stop:2483 length:564 start_codon:yes stop_codon:yes gene_type:complete